LPRACSCAGPFVGYLTNLVATRYLLLVGLGCTLINDLLMMFVQNSAMLYTAAVFGGLGICTASVRMCVCVCVMRCVCVFRCACVCV
jgi:hypothetical protein